MSFIHTIGSLVAFAGAIIFAGTIHGLLMMIIGMLYLIVAELHNIGRKS